MEAKSTSSELELELKVLLVGAPKSVRAPLFGLLRSQQPCSPNNLWTLLFGVQQYRD